MHRWFATILTLVCLVFVPVMSAFAQAQRPAPQPVCCCTGDADTGCCCAAPEPATSGCDGACPADSCPLSQPTPSPSRAASHPATVAAVTSVARPSPKRAVMQTEPVRQPARWRAEREDRLRQAHWPSYAPHNTPRSVLCVWLT